MGEFYPCRECGVTDEFNYWHHERSTQAKRRRDLVAPLWTPGNKPDLLASLSVNSLSEVITAIERKIQELVTNRHSTPMWPGHGGNPLDLYEHEMHDEIRHAYYGATITLIRALRNLRSLA